ncbi:MAG: hypothetical protein KKC80_01010 [Candidatus Margulisbacteria bacterium]|nr:hypothetical protein [Candidatus Margulisiibacteriota bacterium]MBU1616455.1 hypothetical protein [Candidatus Margulisiibacteriota bacterium]
MNQSLPEEVVNWLFYADEDLSAAQIMMREKMYPDAVVGSLPEGLPGKDQADEALQIAGEIVGFTKKRLGAS